MLLFLILVVVVAVLSDCRTQRTLSAAGHAPTGGCVALQNRAVLHGLWTTWITWVTTTVTTRDCVHLSRHLILPASQPRTLSSHSSFLLIELILIYKHTTPLLPVFSASCNPLRFRPDDDSSLSRVEILESASLVLVCFVYTLWRVLQKRPELCLSRTLPPGSLPLVLRQFRASLRLSNQNPASLQQTL